MQRRVEAAMEKNSTSMQDQYQIRLLLNLHHDMRLRNKENRVS